MAGFEQNVSNEDLWRKLWGVNDFKITTVRILKTRTKNQQLRKKRLAFCLRPNHSNFVVT